MKKLVVDQKTCIGCGTCVALYPEVFELGEDGKAEVKEPKTKDQRPKTKIDEAIEACPVGAISYNIEEIIRGSAAKRASSYK